MFPTDVTEFDLAARLALKERLPRTWPAFFERHGNFTAVQVATIPALLDGQNVIVCAPTASGKTEAAIAPLIERYCLPVFHRRTPGGGPLILYLTPTRALVNDLYARLARPLQSLGISLGVKTGDLSTFRPTRTRPPDVLITTPESADSLLTAHAQLLANLQVVVIDEVHLLHGTPRGDHVRLILNRIRRIRDYAFDHGEALHASMQYVALSATISEPESVAARYFGGARVIHVGGGRAIVSEQIPLSPDSSDALIAYLHTFRAKGWRKALAFCNSRAEVEAYAAATRASSPFGDAVYAHYSNIEGKRRREIEQQFAEADAAICFASSTLELGIDIGDIDVVILVGPPGNLGSFVQRIGRGNRRQGKTRVACFYRTPLEGLIFDALLAADDVPPADQPAAFRPAVAVQQIFSLIKQSPTAAVRLHELSRLFEGMLSAADLEAILGQLQALDYLKTGRPGEWRAGDRLNELIDEQMTARCSLSIYSNVEVDTARMIDIRDQHTRRTVARVDALWFHRPVLTLEGRPVNVEWCDGDVMWVASYQGREAAQHLVYRSARQLLTYDLARLIPSRLGMPAGSAPFVPVPEGYAWFHWLGDLYGRAAYELLRYHVPARQTQHMGLCLLFPDELQALPVWTDALVVQYLEDNYQTFEPMLALGPFHRLLPVPLRRRAVVEQFDVGQFLLATAALQPVRAPEALASDLTELLFAS